MLSFTSGGNGSVCSGMGSSATLPPQNAPPLSFDATLGLISAGLVSALMVSESSEGTVLEGLSM